MRDAFLGIFIYSDDRHERKFILQSGINPEVALETWENVIVPINFLKIKLVECPFLDQFMQP